MKSRAEQRELRCRVDSEYLPTQAVEAERGDHREVTGRTEPSLNIVYSVERGIPPLSAVAAEKGGRKDGAKPPLANLWRET